ncbi:inorganic phosphate transporter [bacterium]|nr:inorganic phosphate transporter [bacterium]
MTVLELAVVVLVFLATFDLWVGVTNDAVNFLNSALGSYVAKRRTIYIVATIGILLGAFLSDGMMEVARKGIFNPSFFTMPDGHLDVRAIVIIYLAVMITDVIMLDFFNTFGLPTSTTVSIVSELLGASIAVAFFRYTDHSLVAAGEVINAGSAITIYVGILLSVIVSFTGGALFMLLVRSFFTHDVKRTFKYYGGVWTGICFAGMLYFVIFKAGGHASFMTADVKQWLSAHSWLIMGGVFLVATAIAQTQAHRPERVFKVIILTGTGSLAAAFAGNDLVNFIGPTIAGYQAVFIENVDMAGKVKTPLLGLLAAGILMALALWKSKKAHSVSDTEIRLASNGDGMSQRFSGSSLARAIITANRLVFKILLVLTPRGLVRLMDGRTRRPDPNKEVVEPPYDLLRATVNLTAASVIISIGTANKLPLSTTYVSFMVAMGASLADRCWGTSAEATERRVTGVLVVVAGWGLTGVLASTGAFIVGGIICALGIVPGVSTMLVLLAFSLWHMGRRHAKTFNVDDNINGMLQKAVG